MIINLKNYSLSDLCQLQKAIAEKIETEYVKLAKVQQREDSYNEIYHCKVIDKKASPVFSQAGYEKYLDTLLNYDEKQGLWQCGGFAEEEKCKTCPRLSYKFKAY